MEVMSKEKEEEIRKTFSPKIQELLAERDKNHQEFIAWFDTSREFRNMDVLRDINERDMILNDRLLREYTQNGA